MSAVVLGGCRPEPIASYLKALGALRLVAEQLDSDVEGAWTAQGFVLHTAAGVDELVRFFVERYRPTPVVAPWNGRSGFDPSDTRQSGKTLRRVEASAGPRLAGLRDAIAAGRRVYEQATAAGWDTKADKQRWVQACRNSFPDAALAWLDAIVVLTDRKVEFPPMLGAQGGTLGSMDLATNFLMRVGDILPFDDKSDRRRTASSSEDWLRGSLLGEGSAPLLPAAIGQFDPGSAGGVNSSSSGSAESLVNPWDYVLLIEGSLLFASAAARRLGAGASGYAAIPFTVQRSRAGFVGSGAEEKGRGEVWTPLWRHPATAAEVRRLLGEGRTTWNRSQARSGLDFVRAVATLGVDRGVDAFVRHLVVERLGQAMIAVPLGRVAVRAEQTTSQRIALLEPIDAWVEPLRRKGDAPGSIVEAIHRVDERHYAAAIDPHAQRLQELLTALGELEDAVARWGPRAKAAVAPLEGLDAGGWLPALDDRTHELRLAAALASCHDDPTGHPASETQPGDDRERLRSDGVAGPESGESAPQPPSERLSRLAFLLRPVRQRRPGRIEFSGPEPPVSGLGLGDLAEVLGRALVQRTIDVVVRSSGSRGGVVGWTHAVPAPLDSVSAFVAGRLDDTRIARLLRGLLRLDWSRCPCPWSWSPPNLVISPAHALLAPFFAGRPVRLGGAADEVVLPIDLTWPRRLASGNETAVGDVVAQALSRLRWAHLRPALKDSAAVARTAAGTRLAAALLVPLFHVDVGGLLGRAVEPAESTPTEDEQ